MKTLFILLALVTTLSTQSYAAWSMEKCDTIEQIPDSILPGNFSRILIMRPEDGYDVVLLMKTKETGNISTLSLGFVEGSEKNPLWRNGNTTMRAEFEKDQYHLFIEDKKILTMVCPFR